jgi:phosphonopyruvate decarboxylase
MLNTTAFGESLNRLGYSFFSGVPCSLLKSLINYAMNECRYVIAANEGDAVACCAGSYLAGGKAVFLCQNSGLGNAVSPLASLCHPFHIPVLGFVSLRGDPNEQDEPQHQLMGKITPSLLDHLQITWNYLSFDQQEAQQQLLQADQAIQQKKSFFFIIRKNQFDPVALLPAVDTLQGDGDPRLMLKNRLKRQEILHRIVKDKDQDTIVLATTGYTSRELYAIEDSPQHFYMVGSMGCVSSLALGIALCCPGKKVVAIDGDGALLMRMGNMASIGYHQPNNLLHIVLDNEIHESTGGQASVAKHVNFAAIAAELHYRATFNVNDMANFSRIFQDFIKQPQLSFMDVKTQAGVLEHLPRPRMQPPDLAERFKKAL